MRSLFTNFCLIVLLVIVNSSCIRLKISQPSVDVPPDSAQLLSIQSAHFQLILDEEGDRTHFRVYVDLVLEAIQQSKGYLSLVLPKIVRQKNIRVQGPCKFRREQVTGRYNSDEMQDLLILNCPSSTSPYQVKLDYEGSWKDAPFYQVIEEGSRQYRLLALPAHELDQLFVAYEHKSNVSYRFSVQAQANQNMYLMATGHNEQGVLWNTNQKINHDSKSPHAHGKSDKSDKKSDQAKSKTSSTKQNTSKQTQSHNKKPYQWRPYPHIFINPHTSDTIEYRWENPSDKEALPLFLTIGDWDVLPPFKTHQKYTTLMLSGYGTSSYLMGGQSFHFIQKKIFEQTVNQLLKEFPRLFNPKQSFTIITYPTSYNFRVPHLERHGIFFVPEAWFYRQIKASKSQPILERILLSTQVLISSIQQFMPSMHELAHAIAEYISIQEFILKSPSGKKVSHTHQLETPLYTHDQMKRYLWLLPIGKEKMQIFQQTDEAGNSAPPSTQHVALQQQHGRLFIHKLRSIFDMLTVTLVDQRWDIKKVFERLFLDYSLVPATTTIDKFSTFLSRINQINPTLKASVESYMLQEDLPLINVEWTSRTLTNKSDISIQFTLSQKPVTFAYMKKKHLTKKIWTIPVCLKWGQKDADFVETCVVLEHERQNFSIQLPQKPMWVHPNVNQKGLYYWSLNQQDYRNLLKYAQLNHAEWSSLVDLTLALVLAEELSIELYLETLSEFSLKSFNPITLSLLFEHLNHAIQFFADDTSKDVVRQWASVILQAVMISEDYFNRPPLSHLTQLQLLQWDSDDSIVLNRVLSKKERKTLNKFLRDESSYDPLESDSFDMTTLQYPLLLKAYLGNQKLWKKIYDKFLASDTQVLMRIICLQALAQFNKPSILYQSLDLLKKSNLSLLSLKDDVSKKLKEEMEDQAEEDKVIEKDLSTPDQKSKNGDQSEETEMLAKSIALKPEDAKIMIQSIKSHTHRKKAWAWLQKLIQTQAGWQDQLIGFEQMEIRYALIEWAQALCDQQAVQSLPQQLATILGHNIEDDARAQHIIYKVQRCIFMRKYKQQVVPWFTSKLTL